MLRRIAPVTFTPTRPHSHTSQIKGRLEATVAIFLALVGILFLIALTWFSLQQKSSTHLSETTTLNTSFSSSVKSDKTPVPTTAMETITPVETSETIPVQTSSINTESAETAGTTGTTRTPPASSGSKLAKTQRSISASEINLATCVKLASIFDVQIDDSSGCDAALTRDLHTLYDMDVQTIAQDSSHAFNISVRQGGQDRVLFEDAALLEIVFDLAKREASLKYKVFFDVGMNLGLFTVGARKMGFTHIYAFEPQPLCHVLVRNSLLANGFQDSPHQRLILTAVGDPATDTGGMYPKLGDCGQGFRLNGISDRDRISPDSAKLTSKYVTPITPLGPYLKLEKQIFFLKMDIEGYEPTVLLDILPDLEQGKVNHLLVEINPAYWKTSLEEGVQLFKAIHRVAKKTLVLKSESLRKCHRGTSPTNEIIGGFHMRYVNDIAATISQLADDLSKKIHCDLFFFF